MGSGSHTSQELPPGICFGASHHAIHKDDLAKLEVEYRRPIGKQHWKDIVTLHRIKETTGKILRAG